MKNRSPCVNIDNGRDVSREMTRGASEARHPSHRCGGDDPRRMHAHTSRVSREKPLTHEPSTQRVPVGRRELSGEHRTTDSSHMRQRDADRHGSRRETYTAQSDTGRIFGVPMSTGSREYENGSTHPSAPARSGECFVRMTLPPRGVAGRADAEKAWRRAI